MKKISSILPKQFWDAKPEEISEKAALKNQKQLTTSSEVALMFKALRSCGAWIADHLLWLVLGGLAVVSFLGAYMGLLDWMFATL